MFWKSGTTHVRENVGTVVTTGASQWESDEQQECVLVLVVQQAIAGTPYRSAPAISRLNINTDYLFVALST